MNNTQLFNKFTQALNWNAFSYVIYKLLFTTLSFVLYTKLSTIEFSIWANVNCVVYLMLLWADCGFRKSIPRFAPVFAQNKRGFYYFTRGVIAFQVGLTALLLPLFLYFIIQLVSTQYIFYALGCFLFVTEGIVAIMRLVFHSYFWQKQFNLMATSFMIMQIGINLGFFLYGFESTRLMYVLFINNIITGLLITFFSLILLKIINKDEIIQNTKQINIKKETQQFAKHSVIMWVYNALKSLSERNFLVPFLTVTVGPLIANAFKVANDGALFFYRIVIKTIGTSDTSLFSFIEIKKANKTLLNTAFKKLTIRIAILCIPLLALVTTVYLNGAHFTNENIIKTLSIMATGYLIETLFLPYERILEVKRRYWYLFACYLPYICMLVFLISGNIFGTLSLVKAVIVVHSIRLLSLFCMVFCSWFLYNVQFPAKFILYISIVSLIIVAILYQSANDFLIQFIYYFSPKTCI